ncbi:hypothetical protein [Raineyella fluvialis]|uniref:Electron transfer flavoprotein alpha/beta-subunit N-terminal domain-containing protein n=1 Tax=Raineyella fluvialis TaxID=2662261 RepID=A0A5Q2F6G1_9ACTN|nr:hypothetical protein [Raineyella fluvialis]QGF22419.1 hypothetical protein Rai3103_00535 [Raineyella fluvialis]
MTVVVGYLWVAPPKEATVAADGTVSWPGAHRVVGDSERVAIAFAQELAEASGDRLVGITVGDDLTAAPQAAGAGLARGLDEALIVRMPQAPGTTQAATALAAAVRDLGDVRVVVIGSAASDTGTRMFGPCLAGSLGWPVLVDVLDAGFDDAGLWVVSEAHGTSRRYRVDGPAVLSVSVASRTPRQMGLADILAASRRPSRTVTAEALAVPPIAPVVVRGRAHVETGHRLGRVIPAADADQAATELIAELATRGML